jgi:hypothetical protein
MATTKNAGTYWSIAGLLFSVAGLMSALAGNVPIAGMNIAIGMMLIVLGVRARNRANSPNPKPGDLPKTSADDHAA